MADTSPKDEQMPDGMHVRGLLHGVEDHPNRVQDAASSEPDDTPDRDAGDHLAEGKYTEPAHHQVGNHR